MSYTEISILAVQAFPIPDVITKLPGLAYRDLNCNYQPPSIARLNQPDSALQPFLYFMNNEPKPKLLHGSELGASAAFRFQQEAQMAFVQPAALSRT